MGKVSWMRQGLRTAVWGVSGRAGPEAKPPFRSGSPFPRRPERSSARPDLPPSPARPLAPSASRWNYYSELDKAPKTGFYTSAPIPPSVLFPAKPLTSPALLEAGGEPGTAGTRQWRPRAAQLGGPPPRRPSHYKGLVGGDLRERIFFLFPHALCFGNPGGALLRRVGRVGRVGRRLSPAAEHSSSRM